MRKRPKHPLRALWGLSDELWIGAAEAAKRIGITRPEWIRRLIARELDAEKIDTDGGKNTADR